MKWPLGRIAVAAVALAAAAYGLAEFRGPNGYSSVNEKSNQMHALERENQRLREEISRLGRRIDKLNHDPDAQELAVRKNVGLVRPGDTVYILQGNAPPSRAIAKPAK